MVHVFWSALSTPGLRRERRTGRATPLSVAGPDYQRGSRRRELSPPPPPRLPPPPPKRLPPPPPPEGRASRGRASFTVRLRPSSCDPLSASMARSAPESSV